MLDTRSDTPSRSSTWPKVLHARGSELPRLARSTIKTSELFGLEVGDVISTDKDINHPLEVEIANQVKYLASPGAYKGRKAIKIEKLVRTENLQ